MTNYEDSWRNEEVFKQQLQLNLKELNENYPDHWNSFLSFICDLKEQHPTSLLDIGCGCGALAEVLHKYESSINYMGIDYAQEAIKIASEQWPHSIFVEGNYKDLTKEDIVNFDIINSCSLHNVLQNGDEAMEYLLQLNPKILILGKILTTNNPSYFTTDNAYSLITTYKYFHNLDNLYKIFSKYNYDFTEHANSNVSHFLLRKKDV